jgi:hypothetical protein
MTVSIEKPDFDEPRTQEGWRDQGQGEVVAYYDGESPPG